MNAWGIIVVSLFSLIAVLTLVKLTVEFFWNKRLNQFKKSEQLEVVKFPIQKMIKYAYSFSLSVIVVVASLASGVFSPDLALGDKTLVHANRVGSASKLTALVEDYLDQNEYNNYPEAVMEDGLDDATDDGESRDYTDTNIQVDGVDEGDVLKTDGYRVYYAPKYYNVIEVLDILDNHQMAFVDQIELGEFSIDSLYLADDYLVVIGYRYDETVYPMDTLEDYWGYYFNQHSASVIVLDKNSLEEVYRLETDLSFLDHRLIDDTLYFVSTKWFYNESNIQPVFHTTMNGETTTSYLSYMDMYYFDDMLASSMTVLTSLDLTTFEQNSQGFVGRADQIYVTASSIYTYYTDWHYEETNEVYTYDIKTYIVKYRINDSEKSIDYVASTAVDGYIEDRYWMDESDDYLRVVTSFWGWSGDSTNRLYVLKENAVTDTFDEIALMDENIGHENERVESVRFNGDRVNIVTFERIDPLYTIDLSNPSNPQIIAPEIEEAGYSEYLHIWDTSHHVLGLGYLDQDEDGTLDGIKLSAYDTQTGDILSTDPYPYQNEMGWSYSYTVALYDPKAIMVSVELGLFGFPMTQYRYDEALDQYTFQSIFVIYQIDFERDDVLGEPIMIYHDAINWYNHIDRGVYIDGYVFTFSMHQISSFNLETETPFETLTISYDE